MTDNDSLMGQLTQLGIGLGANSVLLKFSRTDESQADLMGIAPDGRSWLQSRPAGRFFDKLNAKAMPAPSQFLADHPNPDNRSRAIEQEASRLPQQTYGYQTGQFQQMKRAVASIQGACPQGRSRNDGRLAEPLPRPAFANDILSLRLHHETIQIRRLRCVCRWRLRSCIALLSLRHRWQPRRMRHNRSPPQERRNRSLRPRNRRRSRPRADYGKAEKTSPPTPNAISRRGEVRAGRQHRERHRGIQGGDKEYPDYFEAHYNLGRRLPGSAGICQSHRGVQDRPCSSPEDANAHNNLGLALKHNRDLNGAIAGVPGSGAAQSKDGHGAEQSGECSLCQARFYGAIEHYRAALAIQPKSAQTHTNLGSVLDDAGRSDEAIAEYKEAIQLEPKNASAHYNLSIVYQKKKDMPSAIAELQTAAKLSPDWPTPHLMLTNLLKESDPRAALDRMHDSGRPDAQRQVA